MRKLFLKVTFLLLLSFNSIFAIDWGAPMFHFYSNLDWSFFFDKFRLDFDLCTCEIKDRNQWAAGFKTRMVEPIGGIDVTNMPWNFVGLGLKMDKSLTRKQAKSRDDNMNFRYVHFTIFPVLGLVLNSMQDFLCFERGNILNMSYISEVMPGYNNDVLGLMEESAHPVSKIWFANPVAELACSVDCVSSTAGYPMNSLYYCDGCRGSVSAADTGYARGKRPYEQAESIAFRMIDEMSVYGGMLKTKEAVFNYAPQGLPIKSTLCGAKYFPVIIKDQYYLQLAEGSKGFDAFNFGKMRFHFDFKMTPAQQDDVFFWLWREKDSCSGAAVCKNTFTGS